MTDAQTAPFRVCPFCRWPISVGESSIWVNGIEYHSTCSPVPPADPAWMPARPLTEDDVRRIVREELAKEQR